MSWPAVDSDSDKKERPLGVRLAPHHDSSIRVPCVGIAPRCASPSWTLPTDALVSTRAPLV